MTLFRVPYSRAPIAVVRAFPILGRRTTAREFPLFARLECNRGMQIRANSLDMVRSYVNEDFHMSSFVTVTSFLALTKTFITAMQERRMHQFHRSHTAAVSSPG
jgi:hypothetical protein